LNALLGIYYGKAKEIFEVNEIFSGATLTSLKAVLDVTLDSL